MKKKTARKTTRKGPPRPYVMPKTAAELGITCAECGADASWFDHQRGRRDHRAGFICSNHPRSAQSEKLLVRG